MPESSDPYTYRGTDVLRNVLDIRDPKQLAGFEANATAARLIELDERPLVGRFDIAQLRSISPAHLSGCVSVSWQIPDRQYFEGRSSLRSRHIHRTRVGGSAANSRTSAI